MAGLRHCRLCGLTLLFLFEYCAAQSISTNPQNVAGVRGVTQNLELPCSIDSPDGEPYFYAWREGTNTIFHGADNTGDHPNSEKFTLKNPGATPQWESYAMLVQTDLMDVASKYNCHATRSGAADANADVLLLDGQPQCLQDGDATHEYLEGESAKISCQVNWAGSWAPVMEWGNTENEYEDSTGNEVKWVFDIDTLTPEHNGDSFTCTTSYSAPTSPGEHDATNAPVIDSYENCKVTLEVKYGPRNVKIEQDSAEVGDTLECTSDANPVVIESGYTWNISGQEHTGSSVTLGPEHEGSQDIQCCAENEIKGVTYPKCVWTSIDVQTTTTPATTTTMTTTPAPTSEDPDAGGSTGDEEGLSTGAIVGITIGVLAIAVIAVFIFYWFCIRQSKKEEEANATAPASKSTKPTVHADTVRHPDVVVPPDNHLYDDDVKPSYLYDNPMNRNNVNDGVVYADLALDNTPRSRNPIQVYEPTQYAEIRHPQPRV